MSGGSKAEREVRICPRNSLRPCLRPRAHPEDAYEHKRTTPNCRFDDGLIQLPQEREQKLSRLIGGAE